MAPTKTHAVYQLEGGELVRLGPPMAGDVRIKADPAQPGTLTLVTLTLQPGSHIPKHRHQHREMLWCVQKGQGRAFVEAHSATVVPGTVVRAPKGQWFSLRNTGTGALVVHGVADQPGFEQFLREIAAAPERLQEAATQAGIEWIVDAQAPTHTEPVAQPVKPQESEQEASAPRGRRRRRGRRGGRRSGRPPQAAAAAGAPAADAPQRPAAPHQPRPEPPPQAAKPAPQAGRGPKRSRSGFRPRHERVKEVYMNGRWVKVSGDGPVIAGEEGRSHPPREPRPRQ